MTSGFAIYGRTKGSIGNYVFVPIKFFENNVIKGTESHSESADSPDSVHSEVV